MEFVYHKLSITVHKRDTVPFMVRWVHEIGFVNKRT